MSNSVSLLGIPWEDLEPSPPKPPQPKTAPRPRVAPRPLADTAEGLEARVWNAGVLVDLSVSYFRAHGKLTAENIGADEEKAGLEIVKLGRKELFAETMTRPLKQAEARARNALTKRGYAFPVGGARFVPFRAFPLLEAELIAAKDEFARASERFLADWESNKAAMLEKFPDLLKEADYPSKAGLSFAMEYHTFTLAPSDGEAAERIRGAIEEFVADSVETLRARVMDVAGAQSRRLEEGKPVSERQLNSLRRMVEDFKALNFAGDQGVEAALDQLRGQLQLREAKAYKDNPDNQAELRRVLDLVSQVAAKTEDFGDVVAGFSGRALNMTPAAPIQEA